MRVQTSLKRPKYSTLKGRAQTYFIVDVLTVVEPQVQTRKDVYDHQVITLYKYRISVNFRSKDFSLKDKRKEDLISSRLMPDTNLTFWIL